MLTSLSSGVVEVSLSPPRMLRYWPGSTLDGPNAGAALAD